MDKSNICGKEPCDIHGHGSHVAGIMVGSDNNITVGIAPDAEFIACLPGFWFDPTPFVQ